MGRHETSVLSPPNLLYTELGLGPGAKKIREEAAQPVALWEAQGRWRDAQDHRGTKPSGLRPGLAFPSKSACASGWFQPRSPVHSRPGPKWIETGPLDAGGPELSHVHVLLYCGALGESHHSSETLTPHLRRENDNRSLTHESSCKTCADQLPAFHPRCSGSFSTQGLCILVSLPGCTSSGSLMRQ